MDFTNRQFHAHFGLSKETITTLWKILQIVAFETKFTFEHLLWTFYFLKVYNSMDVSATYWKVDVKTYRLWIWKVIQTLFINLNTV